MKIGMISSGNSIHVKKIANSLIKRGHSITLFTLPDHNKIISDFDKQIKIIKLPISGKAGYFFNAPFIRNYLRKNPVDVINTHYASGYGTLARLVGFHPLVLAVFGSDVYEFPYQSFVSMKIINKNLDYADIITSTSDVMKKKVREFYHGNKHIYVTPFGVDLETFHPIMVEKDDVFEIGIVKKIEKKYGIEYLLRAVKKLRDDFDIDNFRLVIYGRGSALEEFFQLSKELNLDDIVSFRGFISNEKVPCIFSHMDVACFPSESESFGVAAVEAMACGIPVVASDASGFTEVIENNVTGYIVPKKNVDFLAEALYKVYKMNKDNRTSMGQAGIDRVNKYYNFHENMDYYENILKLAIKEFCNGH